MSVQEEIPNGAEALAAAPQVEEGPKVYVGNLSYTATEDEVREFMSQAGGEITSVELPQRFNRPSGYAFVGYKTLEQAQKAVEELNEKTLLDRAVRMQVARSKEESAQRRKENREKRAAAKKEGAEATTTDAEGDAKPRKPRQKRERRRQPDEGGDETLVEKEGENGLKSKAKPRKPRTKKPAREARIDEVEGEVSAAEGQVTTKERPRKPRMQLTGEASPTTIFVANLPFNVDDAALAAIFTNLSIRVKSAKVVRGRRNPLGRKSFFASKGFGFVEVEDHAQQQEAVDKVEGCMIGERKISAKIANQMKPVEEEQVAEAEAEAAV
ncbi:hypothetical protein M231_05844 [Tremella mesenterica]|uniref:RRM domain-containing protein n=1 Tax=Tremella mesenterica TaxID=5217 RepID=A0A4Q1BH16_TREME|nr:hypothetical protein M231_05844 [Tremella mesenterica]